MRIGRGLTQDELAAMLFVSRDLISKWETGARRPDFPMIEKIAGVFEVSPAALVNRDELVYGELETCLPKDSPLSVPELSDVLNAFLEGLHETEADMFIRRYYFFESISDVASSFHLKENHIRSTLSRTRKKLKKYIKEVLNEKHKNV